MDPTESSDIFAGVPPLEVLDAESGGSGGTKDSARLTLRNRGELERMPREDLLALTEALQKMCKQQDGEIKFLDWEFRDIQKNLTYFSRAANLAHELNAADLDAIVELAVTEVPLYFRCQQAGLFLYNQDDMCFEPRRSTCDDECLRLPSGPGSILAKLFSSRSEPYVAEMDPIAKVIEFDDGETYACDIPDGWFECFKSKMLVFPLRVRQQDNMELLTLGGLVLGDALGKLEPKDAEAGMFFCDLLSSSIYNAQLVAKLNDLTIIDPLTQIFNRRHLINQLDLAMVQARRQGHPLSIAMVDIDYFKQFNDQYGHICGDEVLREVAKVLKGSIRTGVDVPARYGGEEFMLVMPFTSLEPAVDVADRIRRAVKHHKVAFEGRELTVTCSVGVAEYVSGESLEKFVDRADASLYQAKDNGRDMVCAAAGRNGG